MAGDTPARPGRSGALHARKSTLANRLHIASSSAKASSLDVSALRPGAGREVVDLCDSSDDSTDGAEDANPFAGAIRPSPAKRPRLVYDLDADDPLPAPSRAHPWVQRLVPSVNNAGRAGVMKPARKAIPKRPVEDVPTLPLPLVLGGSLAAIRLRRAKGPCPRTVEDRDRAREGARDLIDRLVKQRAKDELGGSLRSMRADRRVELDVTEILVEDRFRPVNVCSVFVDAPFADGVEPQRIAQLRPTDNPLVAGRVKLQPVLLGAPARLSLAPDRAHWGEHKVRIGVRGVGADGAYDLWTTLPLLAHGHLLEGPYFVALSAGERIVGHARIVRSYSSTHARLIAEKVVGRRSRARSPRNEPSSSPVEWLPAPPARRPPAVLVDLNTSPPPSRSRDPSSPLFALPSPPLRDRQCTPSTSRTRRRSTSDATGASTEPTPISQHEDDSIDNALQAAPIGKPRDLHDFTVGKEIVEDPGVARRDEIKARFHRLVRVVDPMPPFVPAKAAQRIATPPDLARVGKTFYDPVTLRPLGPRSLLGAPTTVSWAPDQDWARRWQRSKLVNDRLPVKARIVQSAWNEIAAAHVGPQDARQLDLLMNTYGPLLKRRECRAELLNFLQFFSDRSIFGIDDDHVRETVTKFDRLVIHDAPSA